MNGKERTEKLKKFGLKLRNASLDAICDSSHRNRYDDLWMEGKIIHGFTDKELEDSCHQALYYSRILDR